MTQQGRFLTADDVDRLGQCFPQASAVMSLTRGSRGITLAEFLGCAKPMNPQGAQGHCHMDV